MPLLIAVAAALVLTPGRAARAADRRRADAGRRAAAERDRVPAAAVQRQGGARAPGSTGAGSTRLTGAVIAALVLLSVILTASVLFPDATDARTIVGILIGGGVAAAAIVALVARWRCGRGKDAAGRAPAATPGRSTATRGACRRSRKLPPAKLSLGGQGVDGRAAPLSGGRRRAGAGPDRDAGGRRGVSE